MEIRLETEDDYLKVEELVRDSFWNVYRPGAYEHFIVHNMRDDECFISNLAHVIEDEGKIIGHISYSRGKLDYEDQSIQAVILGPIAIDRNCQNQGLGSKLIEYTLKMAQKDNIPFVFVVGDENYYTRFGFESASKYNVYLNGTDPEEENPFFMVRVFNEGQLRREFGIFHNPDVFDVDENDVDEFDRQFEYKEKQVKEGQLGV